MNMNSLTEHKYVRIFPDWSSTGVWSKHGNVPLDWLPVTQDILDDITKLQEDFDSGDFNVDEALNLTTEWEGVDSDWDTRVKDIAVRIRLQLPDWEVIDCTKFVC